ncbi:transcriptional regulator [Marinobacter sp. X15-166B]|nr:transcriptional regulator [Marinobacter sp. X15-166B]
MAALMLLAVAPLQAADGTALSAEQWLARLAPALNMTTYRGVFVYARGDRVNTMQVAHRYHQGQVEERLVQQDGANGEIVRKGMRVVCVLPDHGHIQLDEVIPSGPFAEAFSRQLTPVNRWYQPQLQGEGRVAGHQTVVIALKAKDPHRYSYQLWLEKQTGLLVKSYVRSRTGEVLESFQFTQLEIVDQLPDSEFEVQSAGREVQKRQLDQPARSLAPRMTGWTLGWQPEGFMPAATPRAASSQAVAFSDGLAAFSVFVESVGQLAMPTGASRIGATTAYMRSLQTAGTGFLVTVVGEIPPETAMQVAESVAIEDVAVFQEGVQ